MTEQPRIRVADTKASSTPIEHMARIERFVNEMRGINPVGAEFVDPSVARVREALERAPAGVGGPRIDDGHALCPACSTRLRIVHAESGRVQLRMRLADAPVGGDAPMSGQASVAPSELWFCDYAGDVTRWYKSGRGVTYSDPDDAPDSLIEDAPPGWSVFSGEVRPLTAEDFADEDHPVHSCGVPCQVGDEFWLGSLRPATAGEVVAFFDLRAALSTRSEEVTP